MTNAAFSLPFPAFNTEAFNKFFAVPESVGDFARDTMAAGTQSTKASVKGMQDAGSTVLRQMKDQVALTVETGKKLAEAGSIEDAMDLQTGYVKTAFEASLKGFTELSDLYADTVREAFAPLAKQAKKAAKAA